MYPSSRIISEYWIWKDVKQSGCGLTRANIQVWTWMTWVRNIVCGGVGNSKFWIRTPNSNQLISAFGEIYLQVYLTYVCKST